MIITGWKNICKYFGVKDRRTMIRKVNKFSIPVLFIDGRPTISTEIICKWWWDVWSIGKPHSPDLVAPYDKAPKPHPASKLERRVVEAMEKDLPMECQIACKRNVFP